MREYKMPRGVKVHRDDSAAFFFFFFWPQDLLQNLKRSENGRLRLFYLISF
jgi:hypothetical protein